MIVTEPAVQEETSEAVHSSPVIVVGVDGRRSGALAATEAAAEAARRRGRVLGVHVKEPMLGLVPGDGYRGGYIDEEVYAANEDAASDQLQIACEAAGVPWELRVESGGVAESLERAARELGAAVVVVGARHRKLLSFHSCPSRQIVGRCGTAVHVVEHD